MTTKIEIIRATKTEVRAAFYFVVPAGDYSPAAKKADAVPLAKSLTPQEIQDIKDGKILEHVVGFAINDGTTRADLRTKLEDTWTDLNVKMLERYRDQYRFVGAIWDGVSWRLT